MTKKNDRRARASKHGCGRDLYPLPDQILHSIQLRAEAIGPLQAAAEMAAMSSVMFEGYTEGGRLRAEPKVDYADFIARVDKLLPHGGDRDTDSLRRATWDQVMRLADVLGPFMTMAELALQCGLMVSACRAGGWLMSGPAVSPFDFAKRADGTSLV